MNLQPNQSYSPKNPPPIRNVVLDMNGLFLRPFLTFIVHILTFYIRFSRESLLFVRKSY